MKQMGKIYEKPNPIVDKREERILEDYHKEYEKLIEPSKLSKNIKKVGQGVKAIIPDSVISKYDNAVKVLNNNNVYLDVMKSVSFGFNKIEEIASKYTISEEYILKQINKIDSRINSIDEICFTRSYNIKKAISNEKMGSLAFAFTQGGVTGFFGVVGIPFNIALSFFIYFRTVQAIAMYYGYDVKNDDSELKIASQVLINSFSPMQQGQNNSMQQMVNKIMIMSQISVLKDGLKKKSYEQMAKSGGVQLLFDQLKALANSAAKKALNKAGKRGLEKTIFTETLEQIFKNISKKKAANLVPVIGAGIGALMDVATMNRVIEYSEIFYHKRFIMEKESRISELIAITTENKVAIDVDFY